MSSSDFKNSFVVFCNRYCIMPTKNNFLITLFFVSNTLSNARLKIAKNQTNTKQHTEVELLLFENYSLSSSTLSNKNNRTYSEK